MYLKYTVALVSGWFVSGWFGVLLESTGGLQGVLVFAVTQHLIYRLQLPITRSTPGFSGMNRFLEKEKAANIAALPEQSREPVY